MPNYNYLLQDLKRYKYIPIIRTYNQIKRLEPDGLFNMLPTVLTINKLFTTTFTLLVW